ncbi:hypothetical protein ACLIKD_06800 [Azonexus sp. IMCC34842]|uniref:hypothetical protein n=1 Tax=Azonexus sp. IMCC34842 TaxID=3420950 RepID=UPI003D097AEF
MHTKTTQVHEHEAEIELNRLRQLISTLSLLTAIGGRKHPDIDALEARVRFLEAELNPQCENHGGRA